ncbi:MAG TPA: YciI family protein [Gemmatimonadales bacterium]|nr:YciI family protein [Gemmatimonadales bacterium]
MRFMMLVKATPDSEAGLPPDPSLMHAIQQLAEEAVQAGTLVASGGLAPSRSGIRIRIGGGRTQVIDGPFAETKELLGGYAIFDLPSKEAAVESGRRFMQLHADVLGPTYEAELEIRQIFGPEEMGHP